MNNPICPKCGGADIYLTYHRQGCSKEGCTCATCSYGDHAKEHDEHLHYYCRRCSYDWTGPVLVVAA